MAPYPSAVVAVVGTVVAAAVASDCIGLVVLRLRSGFGQFFVAFPALYE